MAFKFVLCRIGCSVVDVAIKIGWLEDSDIVGNMAVNIANFLVLVNSSTNFFVYVSFGSGFREIIVRLCRRSAPPRSPYSSEVQSRFSDARERSDHSASVLRVSTTER